MAEMICPCCGQYIDVSEIRADAIEECINELREEHECWINRGKNDYAFGVRLCIEVLEQLKEQK